MMTEAILLDTNVLIRGLVLDSSEHPQVRLALIHCVQSGIPARLVALMKVTGIRTLLTLDKEVYERFREEISCVHPSELVATP